MNGSPCGGSLRGSPGGGGMRVPVSTGCHTPMSERQQLALIKQLEKSGSSSTTSSHSGELLLLYDVLFWSNVSKRIEELRNIDVIIICKSRQRFYFDVMLCDLLFCLITFFLMSIKLSKKS